MPSNRNRNRDIEVIASEDGSTYISSDYSGDGDSYSDSADDTYDSYRDHQHRSIRPKNQKQHTSATSIMNDLNNARKGYSESPQNGEPIVIRHLNGRSQAVSPVAARHHAKNPNRQGARVKDLEAQVKKVSRHINVHVEKNRRDQCPGDSRSLAQSFFTNPMTKIVILMLLYSFMITGIAAWFFKRMNKIPGLNEEINDLTRQIGSLNLEVHRLNGVVENLDLQLNRLNATNSDLEETRDNLQEENKATKELIFQLNITNNDFSSLNSQLQSENARYYNYTQSLNATVQELVSDLAASTVAKEDLSNSLEDYKEIRATLEGQVKNLTDTTGDLNSTVHGLNDAIEDFQEENDRFRVIISFLEDEANEVEKSFVELTEALEETILRKNALAEIAVEERMKAELAGWECGLLTAFGTKGFAQNVDMPIGYIHYSDVMNYVEDKLLLDFCVGMIELESYLKEEILEEGQSLWMISLNDLTRGANSYTYKVLNYYFPDEGETGLDSVTWDAANHDCTNLPEDKKFVYR